jgi:hypothetical protein
MWEGRTDRRPAHQAAKLDAPGVAVPPPSVRIEAKADAEFPAESIEISRVTFE